MIVRALIHYGSSYAWGHENDYEVFASTADVLEELASPGSRTGHPASYFPTAGDWDVRPGERATVALIKVGLDTEVTRVVTVGPRGGFRVERY